jgi:hypothetical protein
VQPKLACDDSIKSGFAAESTTVLLVKSFKAGDPLLLSGAATPYGTPARYAYWNGFSTGGRQGHMEAQANPGDFDGILAGAPAINWTNFITGELYPQVVYQRDLAGVPLTPAQTTLLGNAAINACDVPL